MRSLLVNALSVTNPSGRHVLIGHLRQVADSLEGRVRLVVVCRRDMDTLRAALAGRVEWILAPAITRCWWARGIWECLRLRQLARRVRAGAYFTPSGMAARWPGVPQLVFAQNPWALVPAARRRRDALKAWLQRRAYRRAMRVAEVMIFNSRYMQQVYRDNAGREERRGLVVYQAIDETTRSHAADVPAGGRTPGQIVSVSVMAPHKNAETLVQAFKPVVAAHPEARLHLVGSWPDSAYEKQIRARVDSLGLTDVVLFDGFVSREQLEHLYAASQVFVLMSRCESFGIPAVEAQLFGTPVVSSTAGAIPEICGEGGCFFDPDDGSGVAEALRCLIQEDAEWWRLSGLARTNAARFTWKECSRPLVELVAETLDPQI